MRPWCMTTVLCLPAAFLLLSTLSCTKVGDKQKRPPGTPMVIGLLLETYERDRWQRDEQLFIERATSLGAKVMKAVAGGDQDRQNSQADSILALGVDALVVVPKNLNIASRIVKSAHERHVPVLAYDRLILNCDLDAYVTFDNEKVGYLQAWGILERVPQGNYILLGGAASDNNARLLRDGQLRAIHEHETMTGKHITILADPFMDNWDREEARRRISNMLTMFRSEGKKVDAIVASNDATAGGAISALMARGLEGKVAVSGQDAELAACQRIVEGTQTLTVYKPVRTIAVTSAEVAVRLARGEPMPSIIGAIKVAQHTLNNGTREVPSIFLEPIYVTRANIDTTVIKDGWQSREKVYANVARDQWPKP